MASTTESVAKAAVDIAGYPLRQQRGMYLRVVDMLQTARAHAPRARGHHSKNSFWDKK